MAEREGRLTNEHLSLNFDADNGALRTIEKLTQQSLGLTSQGRYRLMPLFPLENREQVAEYGQIVEWEMPA